MPTDSLPSNPDIEKLKGHAKTLRDLVRAGVEGSLQLVHEYHPKHTTLRADSQEAKSFKLADAQLVLARHYGYPSWPKLRAYVALVNRLSRSPHRQLADDPAVIAENNSANRADEFLRLGCLNSGADLAARWDEAERLLVNDPTLATFSICTASAVGDVATAEAVLKIEPSAASHEGGPFRWPPLLYLTYSRLRSGKGRDPVGVARLLLEHGADPNAGFLWDGLPSPFTALTGVFGRGEQGAPPHRNEIELARLLLEAGAEANDSQTIYNRGAGDIASDDIEFLELLFEFGLGRGDGGPWRRALGNEHQSPTDIVAEALQHAAEHGLEQRTRVLLANGVDPNRPGVHPLYRGRTPYEGAVLQGNLGVAELLAAAGARTDRVTTAMQFIGACMAGRRDTVDAMLANGPELAALVRGQHGDLIAQAATRGRSEAVRLLVDLGFDVNARHRTTALHEAALRGDLDMVKLLVDLGADPSIVDTEFNAPARGWAQHGGHLIVVQFLDRLGASG